MIEPKVFSTPVDVRFRDLDAMGHVNNAVFFTYFEEGRLSFLTSTSPDKKFPGFDFILAHISCDYLKPVTIDDRLMLQIRVGKIGGKSFTFDYTVVTGTMLMSYTQPANPCRSALTIRRDRPWLYLRI